MWVTIKIREPLVKEIDNIVEKSNGRFNSRNDFVNKILWQVIDKKRQEGEA